MKKIEIKYNPFRYRFSYFIDGMPVTSKIHDKAYVLSKQELPFHIWVSDIFRALDLDLNDSFELIFTGREIEANILSLFKDTGRYCCNLTSNVLKMDSTIKRLHKLENLCEKEGVQTTISEVLPVYTDDLKLAKRAGFEELWPNTKMYHCPIEYKNVNELYEDSGNFAFVMLYHHKSQELVTDDLRYGRIYVIGISKDQIPLERNGDCYLIDVPKECENQILNMLLEYEPLPYLLSTSVEQCEEIIHNKQELAFLLEIDVVVNVKPLPKNQNGIFVIEEGQIFQPEISCFPLDAAVPEMWITSSNESVVRASNGQLVGVKEGSCRVCIREAGHTRPLVDENILCVHRNRIQKICLSQNRMEVCQGMVIIPEYSFYPEDADNTDMIQIIPSNSVLSVNEYGNLQADKLGECIVTIKAENVAVSMLVNVNPMMDHYKIYPDNLKMIIGEQKQIEIGVEPDDAYFSPYRVNISPTNIVEYDDDANIVYALNPGNAVIQFIEENGEHIGLLNVKVKGENNSEWIKVGIAALIGVILIILVFNILF